MRKTMTAAAAGAAVSMFVGAATTPGGTVNAVGWTTPTSGTYNTLAAQAPG